MSSKQIGWIDGKLHCYIEKYVNKQNKILYRINLGDGIFVKGFSEYNEALKFVYKVSWVLI